MLTTPSATIAKPTSVAETLRAARAVIEDRERWTQWAIARDSDHRAVDPQAPSAVRWCMLGAIRRVDGPFEDSAIETLGSVIRDRDIEAFNDREERRHSAVLDAFSRAIAKAEGREP